MSQQIIKEDGTVVNRAEDGSETLATTFDAVQMHTSPGDEKSHKVVIGGLILASVAVGIPLLAKVAEFNPL